MKKQTKVKKTKATTKPWREIKAARPVTPHRRDPGTVTKAWCQGLVTAFNLIEKLLAATVERFHEDNVKPGVVLAYVDGQFYGSVCRYPHGNKQVAFKHTAATAEEVIVELGRYVAMPRDEARAALREMLP